MTTQKSEIITKNEYVGDTNNLAISTSFDEKFISDKSAPLIPIGSKVTLLDTEDVRLLNIKSREGVVKSFSVNKPNLYCVKIEDKSYDLPAESLTSSPALHSSPSVQVYCFYLNSIYLKVQKLVLFVQIM